MSTFSKRNIFLAFGTTLTLSLALPAQGRDIRSLEEMRAMVRESMPAFLGDTKEVVGQLLSVPLAPPLSKTFNQQKAIESVFGGEAAAISADCRRRVTPAGEADQGDCVATSGRDVGKGAFIQLNYSKNMGNGNIKFLKRALVDDSMTSDKLPKANLRDEDALKRGLGFLGSAFGLSPEEIAMPPAGAKSSLVRSLGVAGTDADGRKINSFIVQKVVTLQRGFPLQKPYLNPATGQMLTHVRGPGMATVAVDDSGVVGATVEGWQELRKDPKMSIENAKPTDVLMNEIAEDLFNGGVRQLEKISFQIHVGADWRGSYGLLLPAVQVAITTVPNDLNEDQQAQLAFRSTAGLVRDYSLVERPNVETRQ